MALTLRVALSEGNEYLRVEVLVLLVLPLIRGFGSKEADQSLGVSRRVVSRLGPLKKRKQVRC